MELCRSWHMRNLNSSGKISALEGRVRGGGVTAPSNWDGRARGEGCQRPLVGCLARESGAVGSVRRIAAG
jgi:hypothetical protein